MAIHKNATAIFANFEKCHCSLQTLKNATAIFANFEKCHSRLQKNATGNGMKWHFSKFGIAVAFLKNTRFGVAFIKLTQNKNNWASCWVPGVSRSLCNSLVY